MSMVRKPMAVHECEKCLALVTPNDSGQVVNASGFITCKCCDHTGPLRVRIVEDDAERSLASQS